MILLYAHVYMQCGEYTSNYGRLYTHHGDEVNVRALLSAISHYSLSLSLFFVLI